MKNRFHQHAKAKPRKDSPVDFIRRFSDEDKQVEFLMSVKFLEGFVYGKCEWHEYYFIKNEYILQCKECGKQQTLLGGTILDNSNLSLLQILTALYLFLTSNRGLNAPDRSNNIDVSVKTARRYLRKFRILMAESNNKKNMCKGVCKRDRPLLAEQEYRFNHRYTERHFMEKIAMYIRKSVPMTNQGIGYALDRYNASFVFI